MTTEHRLKEITQRYEMLKSFLVRLNLDKKINVAIRARGVTAN